MIFFPLITNSKVRIYAVQIWKMRRAACSSLVYVFCLFFFSSILLSFLLSSLIACLLFSLQSFILSQPRCHSARRVIVLFQQSPSVRELFLLQLLSELGTFFLQFFLYFLCQTVITKLLEYFVILDLWRLWELEKLIYKLRDVVILKLKLITGIRKFFCNLIFNFEKTKTEFCFAVYTNIK